MFKRTITKELEDWSNLPDRKPLIIRGARQVGKTTLVDEFAKSRYNYAYLNLERPAAADIFQRGHSPEDILQSIFLHTKLNTSRKKTLIFLDEIQNVPEAVGMLRYFYEEFPDLLVVAAGSLLELLIRNNQISFPVGRVDYRYLYPMNFEEYLLAQSAHLAVEYYNTIPCPNLAHTNLFKQFHDYSLIGGMPEILARRLDGNDIISVGQIMDRLLTAYLDDFPKYSPSPKSITHLRHTINSAPLLAGQRIKYAGFGESDYRSREMREALCLLEQAMIIRLIYPTTRWEQPAVIDRKKSPKLFFFDIGLVNYRAGLQAELIKFQDLHAFHRGLVAEQVVYQEIIATDFTTNRSPLFWIRDKHQSNAEIDYLLPAGSLLIPVEVKAGPTGKLRSLHQFMQRSGGKHGIRLHSGELRIDPVRTPDGYEFNLLSLPYFLAGKLNEYGQWFISEY